MAGADRMTVEEVVRKVLLDEHADVICEAVKAVAAEMMELEVSELIRRAAWSSAAWSVCNSPSATRTPV